MASLEMMPFEVHTMVLTYLPPKEAFKLKMVSKALNSIMSADCIKRKAIKRCGFQIDPLLITTGSNTFVNQYLGRPTSQSTITLQELGQSVAAMDLQFKICDEYAAYCIARDGAVEVQIIHLPTRTKEIRHSEMSMVRGILFTKEMIALYSQTELLLAKRSGGSWRRDALPEGTSAVVAIGGRVVALQTKGQLVKSVWSTTINTIGFTEHPVNLSFDLPSFDPKYAVYGMHVIGDAVTVFNFAIEQQVILQVQRFTLGPTKVWTFHDPFLDFANCAKIVTKDFTKLDVLATDVADEYVLSFRGHAKVTVSTLHWPTSHCLSVNLEKATARPFLPNATVWKNNTYDCQYKSFRSLRRFEKVMRLQSEVSWLGRTTTHHIAVNDDFVVCLVVDDKISLYVFSWNGSPSIGSRIHGDLGCAWDVGKKFEWV